MCNVVVCNVNVICYLCHINLKIFFYILNFVKILIMLIRQCTKLSSSIRINVYKKIPLKNKNVLTVFCPCRETQNRLIPQTLYDYFI